MIVIKKDNKPKNEIVIKQDKPTILGDLKHAVGAIKKYAAAAPQRREDQIKKLNQQTRVVNAQNRLAAAKQKQRKLTQQTSPSFGFGIGPDKPKKKKDLVF